MDRKKDSRSVRDRASERSELKTDLLVSQVGCVPAFIFLPYSELLLDSAVGECRNCK